MRGYAAVGLYSPKNKLNVGGVLRAAHCYGAELILLELPRFKDDAQNVTRAQRHIPTIVGSLVEMRPYDCPMIVVEISPRARSLPSFKHPERAFYIFGPEDGSVPKRIMDEAQHIVSIPTEFCMNLAATANVVLYDRMTKRL